MTNQEPDVKLNIFALPSQTAILAGLIAGVLLAGILIGSVGASPIPIWPLALCVCLLPLRVFLARPDSDIYKYELRKAGSGFTKLQNLIADEARALQLRRIPELWISPKLDEVYTFGTFGHWYVVAGALRAQDLEESLSDSTRVENTAAIIIHELYHFKSGDYWQLGYVTGLLRTTFFLMIWAALLLVGWGLLLVFAANFLLRTSPAELLGKISVLTPDIRQSLEAMLPSAAAVDAMRHKAAEINLGLVIYFILASTVPYIFLTSLLWLLYRPKLWRMREYYADAGVAQTQNDMTPLESVLLGIPLQLLRSTIARAPQIKAPTGGSKFRVLLKDFRTALETLPRPWPRQIDRITRLRQPHLVFDSWLSTAILIGSLTLVLDILLAGPLTLLYVGDIPMHFPTVGLFTIVALSLIHRVVLGQSTFGRILKVVSVVMGLRLGWLLLTLGVIWAYYTFAPSELAVVLRYGVSAVAHYAGNGDTGFSNLGQFVVEASVKNLAQIIIVWFVLVLALVVTLLALRRLFTWYSLPKAQVWLVRAAVAVVAGMVIFLLTTILPVSTSLLLDPTALFSPAAVAITLAGIITVALGLGAFLWADRQYSGRCPSCGKSVSGHYWLGKKCDDCHTVLHSWLIAEYQA